jgi:hypothetical protein
MDLAAFYNSVAHPPCPEMFAYNRQTIQTGSQLPQIPQEGDFED